MFERRFTAVQSALAVIAAIVAVVALWPKSQTELREHRRNWIATLASGDRDLPIDADLTDDTRSAAGVSLTIAPRLALPNPRLTPILAFASDDAARSGTSVEAVNATRQAPSRGALNPATDVNGEAPAGADGRLTLAVLRPADNVEAAARASRPQAVESAGAHPAQPVGPRSEHRSIASAALASIQPETAEAAPNGAHSADRRQPPPAEVASRFHSVRVALAPEFRMATWTPNDAERVEAAAVQVDEETIDGQASVGGDLVLASLANGAARDADGAAPAGLMPAAFAPPDDLTAGAGDVPPWMRYAAASPRFDGRPIIAIVIDDLGMSRINTKRAVQLPAPVTLAFLPYAGDLARQTGEVRSRGHELMLHMPMEPRGNEDPGPNALLASLDRDELRRRLVWAMSRLQGYVGVNNHMGSRLTADAGAMDVVMAEIKSRGLLFLDSRTTSRSVAEREAKRNFVPAAGRNVFIDNVLDATYIRRQLRHTERVARINGVAIAIAHPHAVTLSVLEQWLPQVRKDGFLLAPISAVIARKTCDQAVEKAACSLYAARQAPTVAQIR